MLSHWGKHAGNFKKYAEFLKFRAENSGKTRRGFELLSGRNSILCLELLAAAFVQEYACCYGDVQAVYFAAGGDGD